MRQLQTSVSLRPEQRKALDALLAKEREKDPSTSLADVLRDLIEFGLRDRARKR